MKYDYNYQKDVPEKLLMQEIERIACNQKEDDKLFLLCAATRINDSFSREEVLLIVDSCFYSLSSENRISASAMCSDIIDEIEWQE